MSRVVASSEQIVAPAESLLQTIGTRLLQQAEAQPSSALLELVMKGFEQKLLELYRQFQQGECSLGYMAEQLSISPWELARLLEERGLRPTNL